MPLLEKTDVRVTVIGSEVFAVSILQDGKPIQGDWRLQKSGACFVPIALPEKVKENCLELLNTLGLRYGAIDLAIEKEKYYFLEINPTGEWAWLVDAAKLPI
jgi:glutathione synthase/RimK-type ligase-like ATP-grasp enzyme